MIMGVVAVVPVLVAGASYAYLRAKKNQKPPTSVFRCPSCKQQIRYTAVQAGRKGHCPRCWKTVTTPVKPETVTKPSRQLRIKHPLYSRLTESPRQ
jgi:DNA-directed RNA polymerase subunit RPC12/RpoP